MTKQIAASYTTSLSLYKGFSCIACKNHHLELKSPATETTTESFLLVYFNNISLETYYIAYLYLVTVKFNYFAPFEDCTTCM